MNQDKTNLQENWWLHLQGERVYYLQCGGTKLRFVIDEVDYLYDTGYRIINVFVPYHGHDPAVDGPPSYCGLAPIDYYLVAYGFARLRFRGRDTLFNILILTMLIPCQVLMIPQFLMFHSIGWYGTYLPLIVPAFFGEALLYS